MPTATQVHRGRVLLLAYLGFVSLGMPDGLLGVGWPAMRLDLGVGVGSVGWLLAGGLTGYVMSSVATGFALSRLGIGWLLAGSTGLVSVALVGYSQAPVFPLLTLTTAERVGTAHADATIGMQIGAAALGGVGVPASIGALVGRHGAGAAAVTLVLLTALLLAMHVTSHRPTPQPPD